MANEPNIRQALLDYIVRHDPSHSPSKLASCSILELIVIKTELELGALRTKKAIP